MCKNLINIFREDLGTDLVTKFINDHVPLACLPLLCFIHNRDRSARILKEIVPYSV